MKTAISNQCSVVRDQRPTTQSVLECVSPLPLSHPLAAQTRSPSAGARRLRRFNVRPWCCDRTFPQLLQFLRRCRVSAALLAGLAVVSSARAQSYSVDWSTIDGGGGTSTGGVYSVSGTIGQSDAGTMSGGPFTLAGGFWSIVAAVPTPGAPLLSVKRTGTNTVVVSWAAPAEGWLLHATTNLAATPISWTEIPPPYQTNGLTNISFTAPSPVGNKFFRLHKP